MDYSIGMFLAGLLSGTGLGWYAYKLHIHATYGDPKDLKRDAIVPGAGFISTDELSLSQTG